MPISPLAEPAYDDIVGRISFAYQAVFDTFYPDACYFDSIF